MEPLGVRNIAKSKHVLKVIIVLILLSLNNKLFRDLIIFSLIKNVELSGNLITVWFVIVHVSCFFFNLIPVLKYLCRGQERFIEIK